MRRIMVAVLFVLLALPSPLLALGASTTNGFQVEQTDSKNGLITVTPSSTYFKAGETYTMSIIVENIDPSESVEKVAILLNWSGEINSSSVTIISAEVYNETGVKQGSWSYQTATLNISGHDYKAIVAYTAPGQLALAQGWYVVVTFDIPFTAIGGIYTINVTTYHYYIDNNLVSNYHDSQEIDIIVDSEPPLLSFDSQTTGAVLCDGDYYVKSEQTQDQSTHYIKLYFSAEDYLDSQHQYTVSLTEHPITIVSITATADSTQLSVVQPATLPKDNTTGSIMVNITGVQSGMTVNIDITVEDDAGNQVDYQYTVIVDDDAPQISNVEVYHVSGFELYSDGTYYYANYDDMQNGIIIKAAITDTLSPDCLSVEATISSNTITGTYDDQEGVYKFDIPPSYLTGDEGDIITIEISASDALGNGPTSSIIQIKLDPTAPQVTSDKDLSSDYQNPTIIAWDPAVEGEPYTINFTATDLTSGLATPEVGVDAVFVYKYDIYTGQATPSQDDIPIATLDWQLTQNGQNYYAEFTITENGYYIFVAVIHDNAGNKKTAYFYIINDTTGPQITIVNPTDSSYITSHSFNVQVQISDPLSGLDTSANPPSVQVGSTTYQLTYDSDTGLWTATIQVSNDGTYTITVSAYDKAGNPNSVQITVTVDTKAPVISATLGTDTENVEIDVDKVIFYDPSDTTATITFTASDDTSGLDTFVVYVYYTSYYDGTTGENVDWSASDIATYDQGEGIPLSNDGYYIFKVVATDVAGNQNVSYYYVVIDNNAPEISNVEVTGASECSGKFYVNNIQTSTISVTVEWTDVSNVSITYTLDSNTPLTVADSVYQSGSPMTFSIDISELTEGEHTITIEVKDPLTGHSSATYIIILVVDNTAPQEVSATTPAAIIDPAYDGTAFNFVFSDANGAFPESGAVVEVMHSTDGSTYANITVAASISPDGSLVVDLSSITDLFTQGKHFVYVKVQDCAGNIYTTDTIEYYVDTQAPTINTNNFVVEQYTSDGVITLQGTITDDYGIANITIMIYQGDTLLGKEEIYVYHSTDGPIPTSYILDGKTVDLSNFITSEGEPYTIVLIVKDYYGNNVTMDPTAIETHTLTAQDPEGVILDTSGPSFSPATSDLGCVNNDPYQLTIEITDLYSGVDPDSISVILDGSPVTVSPTAVQSGYEITVTIMGEGAHTIEVQAADSLGHQSTMTYTVVIDVTKPQVSFTVAAMNGTLVVTGLSATDANLPSPFTYVITVAIGSDTWEFTIPSNILSTYDFITWTTSGANYTGNDWDMFIYYVGELYDQAVESGSYMPFVMVIHGNIYVSGGLVKDATTMTVNVSVSDCAGNIGGYEETVTVDKGAIIPVMLDNGWNLVSLPVTSSSSLDEVISWLDPQLSDGSIDVAYVYVDGTWVGYIPGIGVTPTDEQMPTIKDGMSFWIHYTGTKGYMFMRGVLPYSPTGANAPPSVVAYDLLQGGNFFGFTSGKPATIGWYLSSIQSGAIYDYVYVFNSHAQVWNVVTYDSDYILYPGDGMWIYAYQDTAVIIPIWFNYHMPPPESD